MHKLSESLQIFEGFCRVLQSLSRVHNDFGEMGAQELRVQGDVVSAEQQDALEKWRKRVPSRVCVG
jgi:hypothetical protein